MMKNVWIVLACLSLSAAAHAAADNNMAAPEDDDQIIRHDGKPVTCKKILSETYAEVRYRASGGVELKAKSHEVRDILHGGADPRYAEARERMEQGKYRVAALLYTQAMAGMPGQKWAEEYCNYGIGNALYANGDFDGFTGRSGTKYSPASFYYKKTLAANPQSRFLAEIATRIPVCLMEEGKFDEAAAAIAEAEKQIKTYGDEIFKVHNTRAPGNRARAMLAITDALVSERRSEKGPANWPDVKDKWMTARTRSMDYPELNGEAVDGLLRTLLAMTDYIGARAEAEAIISKYTKDGDARVKPLLPGAYFVMGRACMEQAREFEAKNAKPQASDAYANARWSFINVIAQFFDNDEYVAKSHYFAGLCYDKRKDTESDAADKAVREWKLIVDKYPNNKNLAGLAQAEIKRVTGAEYSGRVLENKAAPTPPNAEVKTPPPAKK